MVDKLKKVKKKKEKVVLSIGKIMSYFISCDVQGYHNE